MNDTGNGNRCDILYMSHGGGPLPLLGDSSHQKMIGFLRELSGKLEPPDEILVISAHWEEPLPTIYSADNQSLLYDYYGFPPETYRYEYPTTGNDSLVSDLQAAFDAAGLENRLNRERGLDHGVFVPLMLLYPDGGIPVTQLSLLTGLDPLKHYEMGRALRPLKERHVLVIGSGFSFHNMAAFSMGGGEDPDPENDAFQDWLIRNCSKAAGDGGIRDPLVNWSDAPGARYCHPREEHLLPLHVCAGMAGTGGDVVFDDYITGKRSVAFHWSFRS